MDAERAGPGNAGQFGPGVERLADRAISNSTQDQFPGHAITFTQNK